MEYQIQYFLGNNIFSLSSAESFQSAVKVNKQQREVFTLSTNALQHAQSFRHFNSHSLIFISKW